MLDYFVEGGSRFFILGAIFTVVVLLVMAVGLYINGRSDVRHRIDQAVTDTSHGTGGRLRADRTGGPWAAIIDRIERSGISLADTNSQELRRRLIAAGYPSSYAPRWFTLSRLILTLCLPLIFVLLSLASPTPPSGLKLYVIGTLLALFGLYFPNIWVTARADRRKREIVNGFPDALDLMLVCVQAGLGLEAALDRIGREMALSHPLVAELLGNVVLELRAGRSRAEALRQMADRADVDEIKAFSTLIIQSDKLGASMGQALRIYGSEMREKRRMRAEEKAHQLPVLLSIPLVACMLPVMIGVLMLPAAIRVVRDLVPAMVR